MGIRRAIAPVALALLLAGCTSGSNEQEPAEGPEQGVEQVLDCELVSTAIDPDFDEEGIFGATPQAAVAALVASLGLDPARSARAWTAPGATPSDTDVWPLFTSDGGGYGTARVSPTDDGEWMAFVDSWCSEVVPLPLASEVSAPPSATAPFEVPPAPGPDSDTVALATYDRGPGDGVASTRSTHAPDPDGSYVVRAQCLAEASDAIVTYTVLADGDEESTGAVPCDGSVTVNTAILPGDASQYGIRLDSDAFDHVERAYAAIVPE